MKMDIHTIVLTDLKYIRLCKLFRHLSRTVRRMIRNSRRVGMATKHWGFALSCSRTLSREILERTDSVSERAFSRVDTLSPKHNFLTDFVIINECLFVLV